MKYALHIVCNQVRMAQCCFNLAYGNVKILGDFVYFIKLHAGDIFQSDPRSLRPWFAGGLAYNYRL